MNKVKELRTTRDIVKRILEINPYTRNSDDYLYLKVCAEIDARCVNFSFSTVLLERKKFGYPCFESVRRTRQKIQAAYPELAGCDMIEAQRMINEEVFRDYARKECI